MAWGGDKDKEDGSRFSIGSGTRRGALWEVVLRRGPSKNPSVIRNNKDPQAPSLHLVSASLAIIYSCWRPSLVTMAKLSIHSGYLPGKRPPARGNHSSSPSPPPDRGKQTHAYEQPYRWWRIHPLPMHGILHKHGVYTASYLAPRDCSSFL